MSRLTIVDRAAGHPRISAPVHDGDRRLCRTEDQHYLIGWMAASPSGHNNAAGLSHAVEWRFDADAAGRPPSESDFVFGPCCRRYRRHKAHRRGGKRRPRHLRYGGHQHRHLRRDERVRSRDKRRQIAAQDIGTPMLEIRTLGAGGGTLAGLARTICSRWVQKRRRGAGPRLLRPRRRTTRR